MGDGLRLGRFSLMGEPGQGDPAESCSAIGASLSGAFSWEHKPSTGS